MTIFHKTQLFKLANARRWLELLTSDDAPDKHNLILQKFIRSYIRELMDSTGLEPGYQSDLERLELIKSAVRSTGPVYDKMSELTQELYSQGESLPAEAAALYDFLNSATLGLAMVISAIESNHPELASAFALDRQLYQESLEAERIE
jgi:hypothetical protein